MTLTRPADAVACDSDSDGDGGQSDTSTEEGVGEFENYLIDWSMRTHGEDSHIGGKDFKRVEVKGKLIFNEGECGDDGVEVGSISLTQYRMQYIRNNRISAFEVFDETQEGCDVYEAIVREGLEGGDGDFEGDIQVINRVEVKPAHRGHGLALFMIEAADSVINGDTSLCILKPFPLQFEKRMTKESSSSYGYALPPPSSTEDERQAAQDAAMKKIKAYYARLGFEGKGEYMRRWNGWGDFPTIEQAMQNDMQNDLSDDLSDDMQNDMWC